jgi:branched-chain amino acid transport system ATP-binding protein
MNSDAAIVAENLSKRFGGVDALTDVSLKVQWGETVAVLGPNGAGKSTFLSLVSGAQTPTSGKLEVTGIDMMTRKNVSMARNGVAQAHQIPKPFRKLTVEQNIQVAAQVLSGIQQRKASVAHALELSGLGNKAHRLAGKLGLLDLKRLELARCLALEPKILLLDEVAAGLNGTDLDFLIDLLKDLKTQVPAMLFVEHVQDVVKEVAERVYVLEWGRKIAEGSPEEIRKDERVIRSYLGEDTGLLPKIEAEDKRGDVLLRVEGLSARYGAVTALTDVSFEIRQAEILAVLGANGSGKSTLARTLMGAMPASSGRIELDGHDVTKLSPHRRISLGIAISPEGRKLFPDHSVLENLTIGPKRAQREALLEQVYEIFPKLSTLAARKAGVLSGGEQQMVAIGRALMTQPKLMILDEASLGLAPVVIDDLYEAIERIRENGTSVLLIEQSTERALAIADRALLLRLGSQAFIGSPSQVSAGEIENAYLGAVL